MASVCGAATLSSWMLVWMGLLLVVSANACEDSSTWLGITKNGKERGCEKLKKQKNCNLEDEDGVTGFEACPQFCGTCDGDGNGNGGGGGDNECQEDDEDWYVRKPAKNCAWTNGLKGRCKRVGSSGKTGYEACSTTCGECEGGGDSGDGDGGNGGDGGGDGGGGNGGGVGGSRGTADSPEGPSQQCADDAGPPYLDDPETYPNNKRYHDGSKAVPHLLDNGNCAVPLQDACESKGTLAAYLDGPVKCNGKGWFCRIMPQPGWTNKGTLNGDLNFDHCNETAKSDLTGHCHGSSYDETYGWWIRDHWFRGYAGSLHCCCDWQRTKGVVSRCDYRMPVTDEGTGGKYDLATCRDANEDHGKGFEGRCQKNYEPFDDPMDSTDQCWTVTSFAAVD